MKLIPSLSPMNSQPWDTVLVTNSLQVMEAGDIGEVWYSSNGLEDIESCIWLVFVQEINQEDNVIDKLGDGCNCLGVDWLSVWDELVKVIIDLIVAIALTVVFLNFGLDICIHFYKLILLLSGLR